MSKQKRKPRIDPVLEEVLDAIEHLSATEVAKLSGNWVGASTVRNWRAGKTKNLLNYTITAALRAAGLERVIRKIRKPVTATATAKTEMRAH